MKSWRSVSAWQTLHTAAGLGFFDFSTSGLVLRELPPDEQRHDGGNREHREKDRQLLGDRVAGTGYADPQIDQGGAKPDRDEDQGSDGRRLHPAPGEEADDEQKEASEHDHDGVHLISPSALAWACSAFPPASCNRR